ncbi:MAG: prolyl oligopeptidase [Pirellulaceae bacterium]|jgi:prolyl oligopeptidase
MLSKRVDWLRRFFGFTASCVLIAAIGCGPSKPQPFPNYSPNNTSSPSPSEIGKRSENPTTPAGGSTIQTSLNYPASQRSDQTDDYHGTEVADPYRWLEDTDSKETAAWVQAQNDVTFGYLKQIPQRQPLLERLTKLWNYERYGLPVKRGERYFYNYNNGLQNQSVLYVADGLAGEPRLLLDPNNLSDDGTTAVKSWKASTDGNMLAYSLAEDGSDWQQWRVLDVATGELLSDHLKWSKFSGVSWTKDSDGFFYSRYDEPKKGEEFTGVNYFQKLYYHKIGTPQDADVLIYERQDEKEWGFSGEVTDDGTYLIIHVWRGTEQKNLIFYKDLTDTESEVVELITGWDAEYEFVDSHESTLWIATDNKADRRRLIAVDLASPGAEQWQEVIPQSDAVLSGISRIGGHFIASYMEDARSVVKVFSEVGEFVREVELPAIGSAGGFSGKSDDSETFYSFSNFTQPGAVYRYDVATGESIVYRQPKVSFDASSYETKQVFYESNDGTKVPMFITYKKGLKLDGNNPTLLYGYGGFNISLLPRFSVTNLVWLEKGGVYAVPNLRGGGEYGKQWHESGMLDKKQNVFDDFIAAAQWLIDNKYTTSERLAIRGGSNGGLLVGACMTQRPKLFGAALPAVGVMDMLRYHKFTIGWAWVSEYGSAEDAEQFKTLLAYSPLHNLQPGTSYPPTMVTTADHDDRVVPGHSFKFAAELQHAHQGENPVLIRIETSAGHGAGTPTSKQIETSADVLAFLMKTFEMK